MGQEAQVEQASETHQLVQVASPLTLAEHRWKQLTAKKGRRVKETSQVMPELGHEGGAGISPTMHKEEAGLTGQTEAVQAIIRERVVPETPEWSRMAGGQGWWRAGSSGNAGLLYDTDLISLLVIATILIH